MSQESTSPTSESSNSTRFFGWIRGLGIVRDNGWLGGVCGGLAERLGIDPIIVRGIAIVVAILGGPAFLFYAVAWALLPDRSDQIHFERVLKGIVDPAAVGIVVFALLAFLPLAQGVWWAGFPFGGAASVGSTIVRILWSLFILGLIVAFVVWAARGFAGSPFHGWSRSQWGSTGTAQTAGAEPTVGAAAGATATTTTATAAPASPTATAAPASPTATATPASPTATAAPPAPAADANAAELDEWKQKQTAWRAERDSWKNQQQVDERAIREQRAAERRAAAIAWEADARAAREARRAANPRTSAAYVFATIGLALVLGATASIVAGSLRAWHGYETTAGFAIATLVVGLAIVLAGILRRRSGFLTFLSILLALTTVGSAFTEANEHDLFHNGSHDLFSVSAQAGLPAGAAGTGTSTEITSLTAGASHERQTR